MRMVGGWIRWRRWWGGGRRPGGWVWKEGMGEGRGDGLEMGMGGEGMGGWF